jgi:hypothetical protein
MLIGPMGSRIYINTREAYNIKSLSILFKLNKFLFLKIKMLSAHKTSISFVNCRKGMIVLKLYKKATESVVI